MNLLPYDVPRCAGRPFSGAWKCVSRERCVRYIAWATEPPSHQAARGVPVVCVMIAAPDDECKGMIRALNKSDERLLQKQNRM